MLASGTTHRAVVLFVTQALSARLSWQLAVMPPHRVMRMSICLAGLLSFRSSSSTASTALWIRVRQVSHWRVSGSRSTRRPGRTRIAQRGCTTPRGGCQRPHFASRRPSPTHARRGGCDGVAACRCPEAHRRFSCRGNHPHQGGKALECDRRLSNCGQSRPRGGRCLVCC
jgi:hypothetical protein